MKSGPTDISDMPISTLMSKIVFMKYLFTTYQAQIGPKIKHAQNLLKFGIFDISNIFISILMSKIIFINYLPPTRLKLVTKLKTLIIY